MDDVSDSSAPLRDVGRVQFGILSPDEIVRLSVNRLTTIDPLIFV